MKSFDYLSSREQKEYEGSLNDIQNLHALRVITINYHQLEWCYTGVISGGPPGTGLKVAK